MLTRGPAVCFDEQGQEVSGRVLLKFNVSRSQILPDREHRA